MYSILAVLRGTCSSWTKLSGSIRFGIFGHFWPFFRVQFQARDQKWQNRVFFAIFCSYEKVVTVKVGLKCILMRFLTGKVPYRVSIGQKWPSLARKDAFYPLFGVKMGQNVCIARTPSVSAGSGRFWLCFGVLVVHVPYFHVQFTFWHFWSLLAIFQGSVSVS